MKKLAIVPDVEHISHYHSLLKSEWKAGSLSAAIGFTRRVLANAGCPLLFSWERNDDGNGVLPIDSSAADQLRDFMLSFYVDKSPQAVPRLSSRRGKHATRLSRSCEELSVLLNFQYLAKTRFGIILDDEKSFFRNCQSLLVTLAVHFLLPELKFHRLQNEVRFATNAVELHIAQVWHDDLPHQAYLSGMLSGFLGHGESARRALEHAFATTSPEEHDYLTTAHILWYHYLDAGELEAAKDFVLSLYRLSSREHLEEIEEMVEDTYATMKA